MKTDHKIVIKAFRDDKNCAQAVLMAFADRFQIQDDHALSITAGFGAGMGRMQRTCGAVSGAYMVIGLYAGSNSSNNTERKENAYKLIVEFTEKFEKTHGTSVCRDLINCDLTTVEGQKKFNEENISEKVCEKCLKSSVEILNELIDR